jgi:hypothetical protein
VVAVLAVTEVMAQQHQSYAPLLRVLLEQHLLNLSYVFLAFSTHHSFPVVIPCVLDPRQILCRDRLPLLDSSPFQACLALCTAKGPN